MDLALSAATTGRLRFEVKVLFHSPDAYGDYWPGLVLACATVEFP